MLASFPCRKGWNGLRVQESRARNPTFVGIEITYNEDRGRWHTCLYGCEFSCLGHANRIAYMLPEFITHFVVRLHVCVDKTQRGTCTHMTEINTKPALGGELVESHSG